MTKRLQSAFFARPPEIAAAELIGCQITCVDNISVTARIVETEAYGDETDLASHASIYRHARAEIMASQPGSIYVYRSYGIHHCLNIVAHLPGSSGAVLIRAVEPVDGIDVMAIRRGPENKATIGCGPGNVAQALGITLEHLGVDVVAGNHIFIIERVYRLEIGSSTRIGITRDVERVWRFFDPSSPCVSGRSSKRLARHSAC